MKHDIQRRPVVSVAVRDRGSRARIVDALHRQGWATVEHPTGYHLLQSIAGLLDGDPAAICPSLIVVDAISPGCAGTTIASGLRDLGLQIPTVLICGPRDPTSDDGAIHVAASSAPAAIAEIARPLSPVAALESRRARERERATS